MAGEECTVKGITFILSDHSILPHSFVTLALLCIVKLEYLVVNPNCFKWFSAATILQDMVREIAQDSIL